ncbi:MAG TPA: hypothetical protein VHN77_00390 [Phycisphaerales bacterium]|nr:hypothetical protein [Phycisphaerales bacterium]
MKISAPKVVLSAPGAPVEALILRSIKLIVPVPAPKPRAVVRSVRKRSR